MSKRRRGQGGLEFAAHLWEQDSDVTVDDKAAELYPPMDLYQYSAPSNRESIEVSHYRLLRQVAHDSPFYTVSKENRNNNNHDRFLSHAQVDPFTSMPAYSQKYKKEKRTLPKLNSKSYVVEFFPEELRSLVEPSKNSNHSNKRIKPSAKQKLKQFHADEEDTEQATTVQMKKEENMNEDEEEDEEARDTDFERDEDELDDYNAEIYFEDGEQDQDDDFDAGDGGDNY